MTESIVADYITGLVANPVVLRGESLFFNFRFFFNILFLDIACCLFLFFLGEASLICVFRMLRFSMLALLNHPFGHLERSFADGARNNCFGFLHFLEGTGVSDNTCISISLLDGSLYVGL